MNKFLKGTLIAAAAVIVLPVAAIFTLAAVQTGSDIRSGDLKPTTSVAAKAATRSCTPANFTVTEKVARWEGARIYVAATVRNDADAACSAKLQVKVTNKAGALVGTQEAFTTDVLAGSTATTSIRLLGGLTTAGAGMDYSIDVVEAYRAR